jgi:hypothetical protein
MVSLVELGLSGLMLKASVFFWCFLSIIFLLGMDNVMTIMTSCSSSNSGQDGGKS